MCDNPSIETEAPQEFGAHDMNISTAILGAALLLILSVLPQPAWSADWRLKDTDGSVHTLSGLKGKWVLINFWAPWCPACLEELPALVALHKQHRELQVIGVAVMYQRKREVQDIAQRFSLNYPIVFGTEDTAAAFGGIRGLPTSFLYDPDGRLVAHPEGPLSQQDIEQLMAATPQKTE